MLDDRISTTAYFCGDHHKPEEMIQKAIDDGNTILFTTSPVLLPAGLRAAVAHPELTILNCSLGKSHRYVRTYYARMYEIKFLAGAIAGILAEKNDVGYICDYPIFGQIAGINAFALGVEMVNPDAKVYLEWSGTDSVTAATERLTSRGIRLISSQDIAKLNSIEHTSFGLYRIEEDGTQTSLARPVWNWGVYYETLLRRILNRTLQTEYAGSDHALNYYWGMSAGVVELRHSGALPEGVHRLVRVLQKSIRSGVCDPLRGPIYAQGHVQKLQAHTSFTYEQIIHMDWLAENVIGSILPYEQLTAIGRATADMMGIDRAVKANAVEGKTT